MAFDVAVIGAGISGLTAAHVVRDQLPDARVTVWEASGRVGGKLKRIQLGGVWVDVGAEAMLARRAEGTQAAERAGLGLDVIYPQVSTAQLRIAGANYPLPARTLLGIPTDLATLRTAGVLSDSAVQAIADEPAGGPYPPLAGDIAVGTLVTERFGREVVDKLVDPLLGGVYAGRADDISLQMALPALASRLRSTGGSLFAAAGQLLPNAPTRSPVFASLVDGLARLTEQLAAGVSVRTDSAVRRLERTAHGYRLVFGSAADPQSASADAVVLATPAGKSGQLLSDLAPAAAVELARIRAASVAIVTLVFRGLPPAALPAASGVLIPATEDMPVKAMTYTSQKWPGFPSGLVVLRGSLGRADEEFQLQRSDEELIASVRTALAEITGVHAAPLESHVQRWGGGLPQYAIGHVERVDRIRSALTGLPALAVCGASYDGVGIPACIASARTAATRVVTALTERGQ